MVESASGSRASLSSRCAPAGRIGARSVSEPESGDHAPGRQRLYHPIEWKSLPLGDGCRAGWFTRRGRTCRTTAGWPIDGAFSRSLLAASGVPEATQTGHPTATQSSPCAQTDAPWPSQSIEHGEIAAETRPAAVASCRDRPYPDLGRPRLIGKRQEERRAKSARRTSRFIAQWPPLLRDFTKERGWFVKTKPSAAGFTSSRGSVADAFFGASPVVASALGIRSGATPRGRAQPNMPSPPGTSKEDISIWHRRGHFYLALT